MKKLIKKLFIGKPKSGEKIEWDYVCFKTTNPDKKMSYNQWINNIHKQLN